MMVATATLATAEPDGLSPDLETPSSDGSNKPSSSKASPPRRPTSLVIASTRSRVLAAGTQTNCTVLQNHNRVATATEKSSASKSTAIITTSTTTSQNSTSAALSFTTARNSQCRSSLTAAPVGIKKAAAMSSNSSTKSANINGDNELSCFTSLLGAGVRSNAKTTTASATTAVGPTGQDDGLEYASVTYRYLKQMDEHGGKKSGAKVPAYARSMCCLHENKTSLAADESIVSVPCPTQPNSECPTPAGGLTGRSSLRRRHSDLNLTSIANFLRLRFSRHDDTIEPKPGENGDDAVDEMLKRPLLRRQQQNQQGGENKTSHQNLLGASNNKTSKQSCPHPNCSNNANNAGNGNSQWRRPCFRCKNHLIEAILESDATEV